MVRVYQRCQKRLVTQKDYQQGILDWLYGSRLGRFFLPALTAPMVSAFLSLADYSFLSRPKIRRFIEEYDIDTSHLTASDYPHFAAFFTRRFREGARKIAEDPAILAVAEAKLTVYPISDDLVLSIKGQRYSLGDLLQDKALAQLFSGGTACLYRLGVEDYHRYLAAESGKILQRQTIKGRLHTIREVAQQVYPVFKENYRHYCLIDTVDAGKVLQMEIGALLVGKIYNHHLTNLLRGQEKGYFGLGGSSILVLYPKGAVSLDQDILSYSRQGIETQVSLGEKIGVKYVRST